MRSRRHQPTRKIDAFGLFTGQVGYAWNNVLLYVKGGAAVTSTIAISGLATGTGVQLVDSANDTRWGGAVGAGLEFGFAPNWSVGVEYDHLFMRTRPTTSPSPASAPAGTCWPHDSIRQDVDIVTVRVNYTFGGPVVAKY